MLAVFGGYVCHVAVDRLSAMKLRHVIERVARAFAWFAATRTFDRVHRSSLLTIALLGLCTVACNAAGALDAHPYLEDDATFRHLGWSSATGTLRQSHGVLTAPAHARALFAAADLRHIDAMCGCPAGSTDGYVRFYRSGSVKYYFLDEAYVGDRDWGTLDPSFLLQSIRTKARELVGTRYTTIYGSTNILGWGEPPAYDRQSNALTFMVHVVDDDGSDRYDARAFVLGRYGYEMIRVDNRAPDATSTWSALRRGVAAFRFASGYRYEDHRPDDRSGFMPITLLLERESGAKLTTVPDPMLAGSAERRLLNVAVRSAFLLGIVALVVYVVRRRGRGRRSTPA